MGVNKTLVRFISKVRTGSSDGCWEWTGHVTPDGYGQFYWGIERGKEKMERSNRAAWKLFCGEIGELQVLHICDNKLCVNPHHLYLGTHEQNMKDAIDRSRMPFFRTKAVVEKVKQLRGEGLTGREIQSQLGISHSTYYRCVNAD
jgi:hypothetical protein